MSSVERGWWKEMHERGVWVGVNDTEEVLFLRANTDIHLIVRRFPPTIRLARLVGEG